MTVTDKPRCELEANSNARAVCEVCGGSGGDNLSPGTVEVYGRRVYCWGCFPDVGGQQVSASLRDVESPWSLNVLGRPEDLCVCGQSRLVGDAVREGFVLWFVYAEGEVSTVEGEPGRRVSPGPSEGMHLHGTCDRCGERTSSVFRRLRVRSQQADPVPGWEPPEPAEPEFRFEVVGIPA